MIITIANKLNEHDEKRLRKLIKAALYILSATTNIELDLKEVNISPTDDFKDIVIEVPDQFVEELKKYNVNIVDYLNQAMLVWSVTLKLMKHHTKLGGLE